MKVLFLGSSQFSYIVLKELIDSGVNIVGCITRIDKPEGRGHKLMKSKVKSYAKEIGLPYFESKKLKDEMDMVKKIDYDISLVASFGQILSSEFLDYRPSINVHPSLLPKYRGPSPIQTALLNGDKFTGVTIMKVAQKVDSGDILMQEKIDLPQDLYYNELEKLLGEKGARLAKKVIDEMEEGKVKAQPQDDDYATFTKKFTKADSELDLNDSALNIVNRLRALSENVGCYLTIGGEKVKIYKATALNDLDLEKGKVDTNKKCFIIGTGDGALEILSLQSPSGKVISGRDYLNGHHEILGSRLL